MVPAVPAAAAPVGSRPLRVPGPWWRRAAKYRAILSMSASNNLAYAGESLLRSIFLVLIIFIFVQLWNVTYGILGVQRIGSYTLAQMIWYFAFAEAIMLSTPLLRRKVDDDVKSGELAYRLTKPYFYLGYLAADYAGELGVRFALNFVIGVGLALLFVGPIPFSAGGVAATGVVLVGALALDFLGGLLVSLTAFWFEETSSLTLIYRRLVMLLGGMMIPLDVFPEPLASIAKALPFSYMVYGPARLWVDPSPAFFAELVVKLVIALLLAAGLVGLVFRAGQRNVTVNGG